jgi:hypothetical protein
LLRLFETLAILLRVLSKALLLGCGCGVLVVNLSPILQYDVKLEVSSATETPVEEIASQAGRIADHVHRLRYLRGRVILTPIEALSWRTRLLSAEAAAIAVTAMVFGIAILVWILK